jgi:hypothetical protein
MTAGTSPASLPRGEGASTGVRPVVAGIVALALSITHVSAQERPKKGGIRLGPFQVSAVAPFTAGVDSNVYNTPAEVGDESFTIAPTLQVLLPLGRRIRIISSGGIAPYYFNTEKSQRHTDIFGTTRAEVDVGPFTVFGGVEGARYRQRFSLEIDERLRRNVSGHLYGGTVHIRRQLTLTASQRMTTSTFDPGASVDGQPVSVALDRETQTRRIELSVPLTRKTSLEPWIDLVEDRFLNAALGAPALVKSSRYGAALAFSDLAFFNGRAAAGVRHYGGDGGIPPYDGPFLAVDLAMPFLLGSRLQLAAGRDIAYSAKPAAAGPAVRQAYVASAYGANVVFELPLKLRGRILGRYEDTKYLQFANSDPDDVPPGERGTTIGGELLRHFGRHLSLGGIVRYVERKSPVAGRSYRDGLYGVSGDIRF